MDAPQIFPVLLAFMIAALTALGYALQRLERTPNQFIRPPVPTRRCSECGQSLDVGWSHCPTCGIPLQPATTHPGSAPENNEVAMPQGTTNRLDTL